jgi:hypothetical protein
MLEEVTSHRPQAAGLNKKTKISRGEFEYKEYLKEAFDCA